MGILLFLPAKLFPERDKSLDKGNNNVFKVVLKFIELKRSYTVKITAAVLWNQKMFLVPLFIPEGLGIIWPKVL